ncbi:unnamed protein product [Aureobasidium pullulans]|nr:unnamed protein product [Aureobasidium pullulans]
MQNRDDDDVERGDMWSTGQSKMHLPWQRPYATGTPLPGSPERHRSLDDSAQTSEADLNGNKILLTLKERVRHFVWTWFTMTMATGQLANVILTVPYEFHGQYAIGSIFFITNLILFTFNVTMISLRFYWYPSTFKASLTHPTESLFVPASVVSLGTILTNITEFAVGNGKSGYWLEQTMVILFWIYCGLALAFTCGIYLVMWSTQTYTISQMTPVWIFPAYPLLIIGPHAGKLSSRVAPETALPIIVGGFCLQGIGFMMSLMVYAAFLYRLMTQKLPKESLRPAGWFFVFGMMIRAVILKDILWPQKQEDRDEGGWKTEESGLSTTASRSQAQQQYPEGSSRRQAGLLSAD